MSLFRLGIIFSILMLFSIFEAVANGAAARPAAKKASSASSRVPGTTGTVLNRGPANAPPATTTEPSSPSAPVTSKSESKPEVEKVENPPVTEEPAPVKAVKKRGSAVSSGAHNDEGPESLFEDEKGFLAGLDYPELQVVPRASDRLQMEAQEDRASFVGNYWTVQISAIALMMAGSTASGKYKEANPTASQKSENQFSSQMGLLVGGVLFAGTYYVDHSLSYGKALPEIRKINGKDKKSLLMKERLSEEALERPAKVAAMITNLSVWSTFILSAYIQSHSEQALPSYAGLAMGLSFLPWLIENRMVTNWEKHLEYKRKIYAPITMFNLVIDPKTHQPTPLLGMQWRF